MHDPGACVQEEACLQKRVLVGDVMAGVCGSELVLSRPSGR
jgi:hypothetical protein